MIKIKIKFNQAQVLAAELKKEFKVEFTIVNGGDCAAIIPDRELTGRESKKIDSAIKFFKSGVSAVEAGLLFNV